MFEILAAARLYAPLMRAGLHDPAALDKLAAEEDELAEALDAGDLVGAWTELADVAYYAAKAVLNGLCGEQYAQSRIDRACRRLGATPPQALAALHAKYALRSRGIKDDVAERSAVTEAL